MGEGAPTRKPSNAGALRMRLYLDPVEAALPGQRLSGQSGKQDVGGCKSAWLPTVQRYDRPAAWAIDGLGANCATTR